MANNNKVVPKPFLKWAGGKTQLIQQLDKYFPKELKKGTLNRYIEPFLGGGAVFFHVAYYYNIKKAILCDINQELILAYHVVQRDVSLLIDELNNIEKKYTSLKGNAKKEYYYLLRTKFNNERTNIDYSEYSGSWASRAAMLIFLNKTCYNGLFRLNKSGAFNVPYGDYKRPKILDAANLNLASSLLKNARIICGNFTAIKKFISKDSFIYFDPPYRPISQTSSFTAYSKYSFEEEQQLLLAKFYDELDRRNVKLMLSNSDPKNINPKDNFFERLYSAYNIKRVQATRMINCNAKSRGRINELLIMNY